MPPKFPFFFACLLAFSLLWLPGPARADHAHLIQAQLDVLFATPGIGDLENAEALHAFYSARSYRPVWVGDEGYFQEGRILADTFADAATHGLFPEDYFASKATALIEAGKTSDLAELELTLSRALLRYGQDLKKGHVTPSQIDSELFLEPEKVDPVWLLEGASTASDLAVFLADLAPAEPQYRRTVAALARYREIAAGGGWETIPEGDTLKPGMTDPRLPAIRARLLQAGDLESDPGGDSLHYDDATVEAVKRFQYRHGLEQDGAIGKQTLAAFNVPVEDRIQTLILNLERRRWLPDDLGRRYVFVNMAGFELKYVVDGKTQWDTRIIVGTPYHRTPVFSGTMTYLVFNPYWHITPTIGRNEILPAVQKDVGYLAAKNIRVFSDWSANAVELNPAAIDWLRVDPRTMPYKFRQDSGPGNALGRVKFMFPNRHNIYLHDTPAKSLFDRAKRSFSHGCIRVEHPLDMAEMILDDDGQDTWTRARIDEVTLGTEQIPVTLKNPVQVHLTYLTNWVNRDGSVYFREDIYGRDARLAAALVPRGG